MYPESCECDDDNDDEDGDDDDDDDCRQPDNTLNQTIYTTVRILCTYDRFCAFYWKGRSMERSPNVKKWGEIHVYMYIFPLSGMVCGLFPIWSQPFNLHIL